VVQSISKTPVSAATARAIVADAFGHDVGVSECTELTEGWFNAAYSLTLDDGRRVVLKVAPRPDVEVLTYEHDIIRAEVDALRLIGSRTDAPVPEVLWFDASARRAPSPLFLMTYVSGASLGVIGSDLAVDERAEIDSLLGRHLRSINGISGTEFGLLAAASERHATWAAAFGALVESVLVDGERRSIELPVAYDDVRAVVTGGTAALDEITEPRLVYWDLWDGNVMVDTTTHELTGMLDLERALWGDPLMEAQFGPHVDSPALLAAYGDIDTTSAGARQRRALYTMHLHLVMCIEGIYRQYPEDPIGDWARTQLAADVERCR
jgi:aminoglycoside phosphotransferase (APT) family kinase protein